MFIDEISIKIKAWKWWDWVVSWRREKCIPNGWPRWWDGWHGGCVYLQTTTNINTLSDYRHKKVLSAKNGEKWMPQNMHWANWEDLVLFVPVWTIVKNENTWEIIKDLNENNLKFLIARWWRGGFWNAHFATSTRQAPKFAELWDIWEEIDVRLELKLVADIGIIWIPSAWKSTLIWNVTNVKPKIGDYPFTTITPNLWVLEHKWKSLVLEDVPGLIPWASEWKGLWIDFLRHIERTKVLLHLLDVYRLDNVFWDYENIRKELALFSDDLIEKEEIIVFSKADLLDDEMLEFIVWEFKKKYKSKNIFVISSASTKWLEELKDYLIDTYSSNSIHNENIKMVWSDVKVIDLKELKDPRDVELEYLWDYEFRAYGDRLEQIVRMTDFENTEAVMRVYDVLDKLWVIKKIEKKLEDLYSTFDIDNSFFFEGNKDESISPKLYVSNRIIPLDKLKFNL